MATAKAAQLKLAATDANTFARCDGPGAPVLDEILRCTQDDGRCVAVGSACAISTHHLHDRQFIVMGAT